MPEYVYQLSGTNLTPDVNGLRFYDSGVLYLGKPVYFSEAFPALVTGDGAGQLSDGIFKLWSSGSISVISDRIDGLVAPGYWAFNTPGNQAGQSSNLAGQGASGTVTINAYTAPLPSAAASFLENLANYSTANIADLDTIIGDRLYPVEAPQGVSLPFGVFTQISGDESIYHAGKDGWGSMRVQYDFYGAQFHLVHDAARALRAEFEGRSVALATGVAVCFSRVESEFDDYDSEEKIYRRSLDLLFEYKITA